MAQDQPLSEHITDYARELGFAMSPEQAGRLAVYLELLVKWNRTINLVGPRHADTILTTLAADSFFLAGFVEGLELGESPLCLDFGAGAGLPGIVLRILWTRGRYVMVESRAKRASFLRTSLAHLGLASTEVFEGRVQELPDDLRRADLIVSRAFAPWPEYLSLAGECVSETGRAIVLANQPAPEEDELAAKAPGWRLGACLKYELAGSSRYFWSFSKASAAAAKLSM